MSDRISAGRTENNGDCCCRLILLRKLSEGAFKIDSVKRHEFISAESNQRVNV